VLAYYWLDMRKTSYVLTSQRIIVTSGVFSRRVEEVELYRIRDIELQATFLERLCGVATVRVHSTDRTSPVLAITGVQKAGTLKESIRARAAVLRETMRRIS
jgi:uncharacterized membrane protein YdbT with pleckstrin-like domain